ncbi:MAG: phosphoribosyltransferase [Mailhella sp.]|nr:phosphoribosyltransferase [Mailhella sp.]
MFKKFQGVDLVPVFERPKATLYALDAPHLSNSYFIVTSPSTRRLLISPEIVGFENYDCMCNPTKAVLEEFNARGLISRANILTILRGGLNYPLEECCYRVGVQVADMGFLSCERTFEGEVISGLDIRYRKLCIIDGGSLIIGDIIATGDTLVKCLKYVCREYREAGKSLRNIIFFTVGGTMGITVLENFTEEIRQFWPEFEGVHCVFYEGVFSTYIDKGCTGVNRPFVDFYWKDGILAPEYRAEVLDDDDALFEKCVIYDGGARRYGIPEHYAEVEEYWESIAKVAGSVDFAAFTDEKFGYAEPASYEEWLEHTRYGRLPEPAVRRLYEQELAYRKSNAQRSLKEIAERRLAEFRSAVGCYLS